MLLGSLFLNILACTKEVYRKRTRWASRTKSRSRSQNVSGLALYRGRIPNPVSTSYNIYKLSYTCEKFVAFDFMFCRGQQVHRFYYNCHVFTLFKERRYFTLP